jgi:hypothetical protein
MLRRRDAEGGTPLSPFIGHLIESILWRENPRKVLSRNTLSAKS